MGLYVVAITVGEKIVHHCLFFLQKSKIHRSDAIRQDFFCDTQITYFFKYQFIHSKKILLNINAQMPRYSDTWELVIG